MSLAHGQNSGDGGAPKVDMGLSPPLCRLLNPNLVPADAENIDMWVKPRTPGLI